MSRDAGVSSGTFTACNVPCIAHHQFEVVVLVDTCAHIIVVFNEFFQCDFSILYDGVPLLHELVQDVVFRHLTTLKLGVERDIVGVNQIVDVDNIVVGLVQLGECHSHELFSVFIHSTADTSQEFIIAESSVIVLVEVFEDALELRGAQVMAVLTETPHEFMAVHLAVTVVIHATEYKSKSTNSVGSSGLESVTDLLEDLIGWFTSESEGWVHVRVVSTSFYREEGCKLFVVELVVFVFVVLVKNSSELEILIAAANGFHRFLELLEVYCAKAVKVEVFEDSSDCSSFIFSAMGTLSDFLKDAVFNFSKAWSCDCACVLAWIQSPCLHHHVDEVVFSLYREYGIG